MNLTLWYYDKNRMNFHDGSNFIRSDSVLIPKLNRRGIKYQVKEIGKDAFSENDFNLFVIELLDVDSRDDYFTSKEIDLEFFKKIKVVFYYPREGHKLGNWYNDINNFARQNVLSAYFVFSNIDVKETPSYVKPLYINYFLSEYYDTIEDLNMTDDIINLDTKKEKDFLCYNGKYRPSRIKIVSDLYKLGLSDNFISCTGGEGTVDSIHECLEVLRDHNLSDEYLEKFVTNFQPIYLDKKTSDFGVIKQNNVNIDHYTKSYFSIVTETSMNTRFLTEKIYKPLFNKHPFLLVGSHNMLQYLRDMGFYTFDEIFDESYDKDSDIISRYNKVLENIKQFCSLNNDEKQALFNSVKSKLEYNRKHYIQLAINAQRTDLLNVLKEIYES